MGRSRFPPKSVDRGNNVPGVCRIEMSDCFIVHVAASRDPLDERLGDLRVHEQVSVGLDQAAEIAYVGGDEVSASVREGHRTHHGLPAFGRGVSHLDCAVLGII